MCRLKQNSIINRLKKLDKNFWLALPLLMLLVYGVFAQYTAYRAGLLPPEEPMQALAVAGFEAEKPAASVIVAISGAVQKRGYYALPADMELRDFLDGLGLQANSDISAWDLTHQPAQGDHYYVAFKDAPAEREWLFNETTVENAAEPAGKRVNINTATLAELQELPGIGPSRAQAIIDYRVEHNGFRYVEELLGVKGIGEKIYAQLREQVTI